MSEERETLTGVVPLPGMPEDPQQGSPYEAVMSTARLALAATQERLAELRKHRDETNAEIKSLVHDEDLLERMTRVTKKP